METFDPAVPEAAARPPAPPAPLARHRHALLALLSSSLNAPPAVAILAQASND